LDAILSVDFKKIGGKKKAGRIVKRARHDL
jgi:hypothetical protein